MGLWGWRLVDGLRLTSMGERWIRGRVRKVRKHRRLGAALQTARS